MNQERTVARIESFLLHLFWVFGVVCMAVVCPLMRDGVYLAAGIALIVLATVLRRTRKPSSGDTEVGRVRR